jgi:purine-binding chemotaxis protein CheW
LKAKRSEKAQKVLDVVEERRKAKEIVDVEEARDQVVIFSLAGELYGLYGAQAQAIVVVGEITHVPGTPDSILGVINVRGEIEAVLDIKKVLDLGQTEISGSSRLIIAQVEDIRSGLLVDGVQDIVDIPKSAVKPPLSTLQRPKGEYVLGETTYDDSNVVILNLPVIFEAVLGGETGARL